MIKIALSFIAGILSFSFVSFFPLSILLLSIAISGVLIIKNRKSPKHVLLVALVFLAGFSYSYIRQVDPPVTGFPEKDIFVEGSVVGVPERIDDRWQITADNVRVGGEGIRGKIKLYLNLDYFSNAEHLSLIHGDKISAIARLREPTIYRNPGVYSYDAGKDGIIATGYVKSLKKVGQGSGLLAYIHRNRQRLGQVMDRSLSEETAAFLKAIIPGLKRGISPEMRDAFSATGLAHMLSISGTHFGLLAFIFFTFVKSSVRCLPIRIFTRLSMYQTPTQAAVITTLPVLILYALISGMSMPTIRSLIMVFIYMLALYLGRRDRWLNSLGIAALIILVQEPSAVFELSFELSFLAVLTIGFAIERRNRHLDNQDSYPVRPGAIKTVEAGKKTILERIRTALIITVAAVLGTAPIVAAVFNQFPLISPITNLIITPLVCFILLPLGFISGFLALLFNQPLLPFNMLIDYTARSILKIIALCSSFPYSHIHIHAPSALIVLLYFITIALIVRLNSRWRYVPFMLVITAYLTLPHLSGGHLKVTFLDVGQGESAVVELPDNKVILIDGGSEKKSMGRRVVAPFLWSRGINEIDYLVLSHGHSDHFGGLLYIMDEFEIGEVWSNGRETYDMTAFNEKLKEKGISCRVLGRGDLVETEGYRIYVIHPYAEFYAGSQRGGFSEENSDSLVLKIETENLSLLFTGDIEEEAENNIIHLGDWLKSEIIKVPHHGGRTSSTEEFLRFVRPDIAVVSVGKDNSFGHPHHETLKRYMEAGAELFRTDRDGAVTLTVKDGQYEIETFRDRSFRKVKNLDDELRNLKLLL